MNNTFFLISYFRLVNLLCSSNLFDNKKSAVDVTLRQGRSSF